MDVSEGSSVLFPMVNPNKKNEGTRKSVLIFWDRINILVLNQSKELLKHGTKKPLKSPDLNYTSAEA